MAKRIREQKGYEKVDLGEMHCLVWGWPPMRWAAERHCRLIGAESTETVYRIESTSKTCPWADRTSDNHLSPGTPPSEQTNRMDELPDEILEKIFVYLNVRDLIQCSMVCKQWKNVAYRDHLWKAVCVKDGIEVEHDISTFTNTVSEVNRWKYYYQSFVERCLNWGKNRYENHWKGGDAWYFQGWASCQSVCLLPTYSDNTIDVFTISRYTFKLDQKIQVPIPGLEPTFLATDIQSIVAVKSNILLVYRKKATEYVLAKAYACNDKEFVKCTEDCNYEDNVRNFIKSNYRRCGVVRIVHFKNNVIWLCDYYSGRVIIISEETERILYIRSVTLFKTGPCYVCFWNSNVYKLCSIEGEEKFILHNKGIDSTSFSENYLAIKLSGVNVLEIWSIKDNKLLRVLHVVADSFLVHENFVYIVDLDKQTVGCWSAEPGTDLKPKWKETYNLSIPSPSPIFPCQMVIILDKYLAIFPSHKYKKKYIRFTVLDPATGNTLYTSPFSGILIEANDRLMVTLSNTIDTGNNISIRSYI